MSRELERMREERNAYRLLVVKPEENRPLGSPRCRWMEDIKMGLRKDRVVFIELIWLRVGTSGGLL
jgi:hypothetical protein